MFYEHDSWQKLQVQREELVSARMCIANVEEELRIGKKCTAVLMDFVARKQQHSDQKLPNANCEAALMKELMEHQSFV